MPHASRFACITALAFGAAGFGIARAADQAPTSAPTPPPTPILCGSITWSDPSLAAQETGDVEVALQNSKGEPIALVNATDLDHVPQPCRSRLRPPFVPAAGPGQRTAYFGFVSQRVGEAGATVVTLTVAPNSSVGLRCTYQGIAMPCATAAGLTSVVVPSSQQLDLRGVSHARAPMQANVLAPSPAPIAPAAPAEEATPSGAPSPVPSVATPGPISYVTDRRAAATPPAAPNFFENERSAHNFIGCAVTDGSNFFGDLCYMSYGKIAPNDTAAPLSFAKPSDAAKALHDQILADYPGAAQVVLFIPGFNHGFQSSLSDARALSRALNVATAGNPTIPVIVYSWPTKAADYPLPLIGLKYPDDETNNTWSALHLREFLGAFLDADPSRPLTVHVLAHSMGNRLLLDVLLMLRAQTLAEDGYKTPCTPSTQPGNYCKRIGEVITIEPDVDEQTFAEETEALADFAYGTTLYGSTIDLALKASQKIHGHCRGGELDCGDAYFAQTLTVIDATNLRNCDPIAHHSYWPYSSIVLSDLATLITTTDPTMSQGARAHLEYSATPLVTNSVIASFPHYEVNQSDADGDCR